MNTNKFKLLRHYFDMAPEQIDYSAQITGNLNSKVRDIEEKQRILKDRLLLIGQNLIEIKEKSTQQMLDVKKDIENIKQTMGRLSSFLETISNEFSKFAKKEDLEILTRQAKMFQPMELVTKKELEHFRKN